MTFVHASQLIEDIAEELGEDPSAIDSRIRSSIVNALSQALQTVWSHHWWSDLMRTEQTLLAEQFLTGSSLAQTGQVFYWPLTDWYYMAYLDDLDTDPTGSTGTVNDYWLELDVDYSQATLWSPSTTYALGDICQYNNAVWVCRIPALSSRPGDDNTWQAVSWTPQVPWTDNSAVIHGPYGDILSISRLDPETTSNPGEFTTDETLSATRVLGLDVGRPWIYYRRPAPVISATDYDATTAYSATPAAEITYETTL